MNETYDYGLWSMVILNSAIFIFFAFSFVSEKSQALQEMGTGRTRINNRK